MKKRTTDLYPIQVNPFNFQRGDAVKKFYTDQIVTPYVGVVTAIVPSTNKVEVQWPYGMGIEDPSELIKVNPLLFPPVVNEDKSYKTYQNQLSHDYFEKIQPYSVLNDYVKNEFNPLVLKASECYNKGLDKKAALRILANETDNKEMMFTALEKVYSDNIKMYQEFATAYNKVSAQLTGNSNDGFILQIEKNGEVKKFKYPTLQKAYDSYMKFKDVISNLSDSQTIYETAVKEAAKKLSKKEK